MSNIVSIKNLNKIFRNNFKALNNLSLDIKKGEIFALLGPNGAGKSTLINIICGITNSSSGSIFVNGFNIIKDFRKTRSMIGLVPQELNLEAFETVWDNVCYSRGLYGKSNDFSYIKRLLKELSIYDKKDNILRELSGGMKRRVLIAKALSHEPSIIFLDEPSASVDVELRKDMWEVVKRLRDKGVTIILTTHYIEEAEEIADRVGIINKGEIILVDRKDDLIKKLGQKTLIINFHDKIQKLPDTLSKYNLFLDKNENTITYTYDTKKEKTGITSLLNDLREAGLNLKDINTKKSSLENIFTDLVKGDNNELLRS